MALTYSHNNQFLCSNLCPQIMSNHAQIIRRVVVRSDTGIVLCCKFFTSDDIIIYYGPKAEGIIYLSLEFQIILLFDRLDERGNIPSN